MDPEIREACLANMQAECLEQVFEQTSSFLGAEWLVQHQTLTECGMDLRCCCRCFSCSQWLLSAVLSAMKAIGVGSQTFFLLAAG